MYHHMEYSIILPNIISILQLMRLRIREGSVCLNWPSTVTSEASQWEKNKLAIFYYTRGWQRTDLCCSHIPRGLPGDVANAIKQQLICTECLQCVWAIEQEANPTVNAEIFTETQIKRGRASRILTCTDWGLPFPEVQKLPFLSKWEKR